MPKKKARKKVVRKKAAPLRSRKKSWWGDYKYYIIPSFIGACIAWFFSASMLLSVMVFLAVWIGNWVGRVYVTQKR